MAGQGVEARYTLRNDGGALIYVENVGYRHGPAEVLARLARGEPVDPAEYYFRTHIRLTTGSPRLAWMNRRIFLSNGRREQTRVTIEVFEVR